MTVEQVEKYAAWHRRLRVELRGEHGQCVKQWMATPEPGGRLPRCVEATADDGTNRVLGCEALRFFTCTGP